MRRFHHHPVIHNKYHVIPGLRYVIPGLTRNLLAVLAVSLTVSCGGDEPIDPTPPTPAKDTKAPTITVSVSTVNVIAGPAVTISGSELKIGDKSVATWKDDKSTSCTVSLSFTPAEGSAKTLNSWDKVSEAGKLQIKATDEAGNSATAEISLTREDSQAPQIAVAIHDKNVIAGVTITVQDNQLLFNEEVAASWTDDFTAVCTTELSLIPAGASEAKAIASGEQLSEAGTLKLAVADEFDNKATAEINLTAIAVYGLENLLGKQLQVDQEANLLEGLTFAEGLTLQKIEIELDNILTEIADPKAYTPEYPGSVNLILTITKPDGNTIQERVDALTVKPLDYSIIVFKAADIFNMEYSWFSNLRKATQEYMYWDIFASYDNLVRPKNDNRKNVVMWETANPKLFDMEYIWIPFDPEWWWGDASFDHGNEEAYRYQLLCQNIPLLCCNGDWNDLELYIDQHPDYIYIVSCASESLCGPSDSILERPMASHLRNILKKNHVILLCMTSNQKKNSDGTLRRWRVYNETVKGWHWYNWSSFNSELPNKITVMWMKPWSEIYYCTPEWATYGGIGSCLPTWYDINQRNIVMSTCGGLNMSGKETNYTYSSEAVANQGARISNLIAIVKSNHPGITAVDAMQIIIDNYFTERMIYYKDETTNWELREGCLSYDIDVEKLLQYERLQKGKLDDLAFDSDLVELPVSEGLCYVGKGVQFEYEGKYYNSDEKNHALLTQLVQSDQPLKWRWNKALHRKQGGGKDEVSFDVYVVDKSCEQYLSLTFSKRIN